MTQKILNPACYTSDSDNSRRSSFSSEEDVLEMIKQIKEFCKNGASNELDIKTFCENLILSRENSIFQRISTEFMKLSAQINDVKTELKGDIENLKRKRSRGDAHFTSKVAKDFAIENNISHDEITQPSGKNGKITKKDIQKYISERRKNYSSSDEEEDEEVNPTQSYDAEEISPEKVSPGSPKEVSPGSPKEVSPEKVSPGSPKEVSPEKVSPESPKEVSPEKVSPESPKEVSPEKKKKKKKKKNVFKTRYCNSHTIAGNPCRSKGIHEIGDNDYGVLYICSRHLEREQKSYELSKKQKEFAKDPDFGQCSLESYSTYDTETMGPHDTDFDVNRPDLDEWAENLNKNTDWRSVFGFKD